MTTEVVFHSDDISDIKRKGLEMSRKHNIVESEEWANLMEENGIGGVTSTSFKPGNEPWCKGKKLDSVSEKRKEYWRKWREKNPDYKSNWKINKRTKKGITEETREVWKKSVTKTNKSIIECPHCKKTGNPGNMKRWHFDKCRDKNG